MYESRCLISLSGYTMNNKILISCILYVGGLQIYYMKSELKIQGNIHILEPYLGFCLMLECLLETDLSPLNQKTQILEIKL